jgi:AICAR transformylase/IMP cyclohydrolase PurH
VVTCILRTTVARPDVAADEAVENIDMEGRPSPSAAKNFTTSLSSSIRRTERVADEMDPTMAD